MDDKTKIDIVILSYAKDEALKALTVQTIDTLLQSEDPEKIAFNVVVVESNKSLKPYQFANSTTIYPDVKFGFNRYLNIGAQATNNPYICFCNNDLIFHKGWASAILNLMATGETILSAAPFCPVTHVRDGYPFKEAYLPIYHIFSGWCFLIKRELLKITGPFDDKYKFWYADVDYLNTLKKHGIKNYMVTASQVTHIGSKTSETLEAALYKSLTAIPNAYHNYKWKHKNYPYYLLKKLYLQTLIKLKII